MTQQPTVVSVVGARPQFVKAAAVSPAVRLHPPDSQDRCIELLTVQEPTDQRDRALRA